MIVAVGYFYIFVLLSVIFFAQKLYIRRMYFKKIYIEVMENVFCNFIFTLFNTIFHGENKSTQLKKTPQQVIIVIG